jgi:riboflavin kinase/FMN adenylyltransferase
MLSRSLDRIPPAARGGAISVGNFDGVHRGHAVLIDQLRRQAERVGGPAVVVTFEPHRAAILRPDREPPRLTSLERRASLLEQLGIDHVIACPVDLDFLAKSAETFFQQVALDALDARAMVEGPNFFFGRNREGDIDRLQALCDASGLSLQIVAPHRSGETMISSTRIRQLLAGGEIERANRLLTAPYALQGRVEAGASRGATLGFPTANLGKLQNMPPQHGVYACRVPLAEGTRLAATHIGPNPTFDEADAKVEVHLLDWQGDLYGQPLQVDFLHKVRDIARFDSVDALQQQLQSDIAQVRQTAT